MEEGDEVRENEPGLSRGGGKETDLVPKRAVSGEHRREPLRWGEMVPLGFAATQEE